MNNKWQFISEELPKINNIRPLPEQSVFNYYFSELNDPLNCCLLPGVEFKQIGNGSQWDDCYKKFHNVIIDTKGWMNKSPLDLYYWSALLRTPWKNEAVEFFNSGVDKNKSIWRRIIRR